MHSLEEVVEKLSRVLHQRPSDGLINLEFQRFFGKLGLQTRVLFVQNDALLPFDVHGEGSDLDLLLFEPEVGQEGLSTQLVTPFALEGDLLCFLSFWV
jgi:hypothetical protein